MFHGVADLTYAITRNIKYCDDECKAELDSINLKGAESELKASAGIIALGIIPQLATTSTLLAGGINSGVDLSMQLMDKKGYFQNKLSRCSTLFWCWSSH